MTVANFKAVESELNQRYLDRTEEIHGLTLAVLSRQHIELLGPPGNAKTMLIKDFADYLDVGNDFFSWLMTKFSTPEELFGPVSIAAMKAGSYTRITTHKMPEAKVAYLDEIFKASSPILNALLSILQERVYHNNGGATQCPLILCVASSNELPDEDEGLGALHDRFLLRYNPGYIADKTTFEQLLRLEQQPKTVTSITEAEVQQDIAAVAQLKLSDEAVESLTLVWEKIHEAGIAVSDRRFKQMIGVMAAESWLMGATEIVADSVSVGEHIMWNTPDDIIPVKQIIRSSVNPSMARAQEILTAATAAMADLAGDFIQSEEMLTVAKQLQFLAADLESLTQSQAVVDIGCSIKKMRDGLVQRMLSSQGGAD